VLATKHFALSLKLEGFLLVPGVIERVSSMLQMSLLTAMFRMSGIIHYLLVRVNARSILRVELVFSFKGFRALKFHLKSKLVVHRKLDLTA
jgi:hypothetical protein